MYIYISLYTATSDYIPESKQYNPFPMERQLMFLLCHGPRHVKNWARAAAGSHDFEPEGGPIEGSRFTDSNVTYGGTRRCPLVVYVSWFLN